MQGAITAYSRKKNNVSDTIRLKTTQQHFHGCAKKADRTAAGRLLTVKCTVSLFAAPLGRSTKHPPKRGELFISLRLDEGEVVGWIRKKQGFFAGENKIEGVVR